MQTKCTIAIARFEVNANRGEAIRAERPLPLSRKIVFFDGQGRILPPPQEFLRGQLAHDAFPPIMTISKVRSLKSWKSFGSFHMLLIAPSYSCTQVAKGHICGIASAESEHRNISRNIGTALGHEPDVLFRIPLDQNKLTLWADVISAHSPTMTMKTPTNQINARVAQPIGSTTP